MRIFLPVMLWVLCLSLFFSIGFAGPTAAQGVLTEKQLSLALALDAAKGAMDQCRKDGYRVSVAVLDRTGQIKALMRDDGAGIHTVDTSRRKAYTSLSFRTSTAEFANRVATVPGAANLKDITDVIALAGGLPIRAGNEVIGAIGVGGAPGGDKDEVCAKAGLDAIAQHLK